MFQVSKSFLFLPTGSTGAIGPTGPAGFEIRQIVVGTSASVRVQGSLYQIQAPRGYTGPTGPTGTSGPEGVAGPRGHDGPRGRRVVGMTGPEFFVDSCPSNVIIALSCYSPGIALASTPGAPRVNLAAGPALPQLYTSADGVYFSVLNTTPLLSDKTGEPFKVTDASLAYLRGAFRIVSATNPVESSQDTVIWSSRTLGRWTSQSGVVKWNDDGLGRRALLSPSLIRDDPFVYLVYGYISSSSGRVTWTYSSLESLDDNASDLPSPIVPSGSLLGTTNDASSSNLASARIFRTENDGWCLYGTASNETVVQLWRSQTFRGPYALSNLVTFGDLAIRSPILLSVLRRSLAWNCMYVEIQEKARVQVVESPPGDLSSWGSSRYVESNSYGLVGCASALNLASESNTDRASSLFQIYQARAFWGRSSRWFGSSQFVNLYNLIGAIDIYPSNEAVYSLKENSVVFFPIASARSFGLRFDPTERSDPHIYVNVVGSNESRYLPATPPTDVFGVDHPRAIQRFLRIPDLDVYALATPAARIAPVRAAISSFATKMATTPSDLGSANNWYELNRQGLVPWYPSNGGEYTIESDTGVLVYFMPLNTVPGCYFRMILSEKSIIRIARSPTVRLWWPLSSDGLWFEFSAPVSVRACHIRLFGTTWRALAA